MNLNPKLSAGSFIPKNNSVLGNRGTELTIPLYVQAQTCYSTPPVHLSTMNPKLGEPTSGMVKDLQILWRIACQG